MKLMKRVVIIGCGSIGKRHIRNLKTLGITEIYCLRTRKGFTQDLPTNIQVEEVYSWSDLIKKKPDIAFITNPTSLHIETAKKIIPHIKGLFIEKPLSHNLDGVSNLLKLVEKYKVVTFMGFNIEFHPLIIEIGKLISNGDIGDVVNYQATTGQCIEKWHPYEDYHNSYAVRKDLGGGAALTLIHEINLALNQYEEVEDIDTLTKATKNLIQKLRYYKHVDDSEGNEIGIEENFFTLEDDQDMKITQYINEKNDRNAEVILKEINNDYISNIAEMLLSEEGPIAKIENSNAVTSIGTLEFIDKISKYQLTKTTCMGDYRWDAEE